MDCSPCWVKGGLCIGEKRATLRLRGHHHPPGIFFYSFQWGSALPSFLVRSKFDDGAKKSRGIIAVPIWRTDPRRAGNSSKRSLPRRFRRRQLASGTKLLSNLTENR